MRSSSLQLKSALETAQVNMRSYSTLIPLLLASRSIGIAAAAAEVTGDTDNGEYPRNMVTPRPSETSSQGVHRWAVPCSAQYTEPAPDGRTPKQHPQCTPEQCKRVVVDGFVTPEENAALLAIAEKGFAFSSDSAATGGPTIMDINSGYVRDQDGLINMYAPDQQLPPSDGTAAAKHDRFGATPVQFDEAEYALYKRTIQRIRQRIIDEFELGELYFTAPTFITREVGNGTHWAPKSMHDEYWHPHVDKNNTAHYDFSGLLYLNDHGLDYSGGMFAFLDGARPSQAMPCYDEDLQAMGSPQSCGDFQSAGMCDRSVGGDAVVADYCPAACGRCTPSYTPPAVTSDAAETLDFEYAEDGEELSEGQTVHLVEPAAGRLVMFSSGRENVHQVCDMCSSAAVGAVEPVNTVACVARQTSCTSQQCCTLCPLGATRSQWYPVRYEHVVHV